MQVLNQPGKKQRIEVLAFSPACDTLLAAGNGSWLTVWQLAGAAPLCRVFETDNSYAWVKYAEYIGGGKAVAATCGTDGLRIHPITPDSPFRPTRLVWGASLWGLAISPDGRRVIASTGCMFSPPPPGEHGLVSWRAGAGNRFRRDWSVSFE